MASNFCDDLYRILSRNDDNLIFSPISIQTVLSLLHQASAGKTRQTIADVLKPDPNLAIEDRKFTQALNALENVTLHIATKIYAKDNYKIKESFLNATCHCEVERLGFEDNVAAASAINSWAERKTKHKIRDLIAPESLDDSTRLLLVNAVYFGGNWAEKFDEARTVKKPFYVGEGRKKMVDTMHAMNTFRYGEDDDLGATILKLPYQNRDVSMLIVLPNEKSGLGAMEKKLASADLAKIESRLYDAEVMVALPKFTIESKVDLSKALKELGLSAIFTEGADFSGIFDSQEPLNVSQVLQKFCIVVNEEGAEAAAISGVQIMMKNAVLGKEFKADHPFAFLLVANCEETTSKMPFLLNSHASVKLLVVRGQYQYVPKLQSL